MAEQAKGGDGKSDCNEIYQRQKKDRLRHKMQPPRKELPTHAKCNLGS